MIREQKNIGFKIFLALGELSIWFVAGSVLGVATVFALGGHIPFFLVGLVLGVCGGVFQLVKKILWPNTPWWLSMILITVLALSTTVLLFPDARQWKLIVFATTYHTIFSAVFFCLFNRISR